MLNRFNNFSSPSQNGACKLCSVVASLFRVCSKIARRCITRFLCISLFAPFHNGDDICFYSDVKAINLVIARHEMNVTERRGQKQNDIERGRTAAKNGFLSEKIP
jgi:hypothetical protein